MFNGKITEIGTVAGCDGGLVIEAPKTSAGIRPGGSVCVSGVCLSATAVGDGWFRADVSAETARRSTLAERAVGDRVNLERPLQVGDPLDGHLVQGHVDAVGKVTLLDDDAGGGAVAFLLSAACGHTTVPCDRDRLDRLEIPPMPGPGDRHGTA